MVAVLYTVLSMALVTSYYFLLETFKLDSTIGCKNQKEIIKRVFLISLIFNLVAALYYLLFGIRKKLITSEFAKEYIMLL